MSLDSFNISLMAILYLDLILKLFLTLCIFQQFLSLNPHRQKLESTLESHLEAFRALEIIPEYVQETIGSEGD